MEQSTLSLSSSVSKESVYEGMSVVLAGIEDYKKQQIDGKEEEIISNERIQKNDIILGTYQVSSDAISGGMGSVWRVHHKDWNVDLAMKRPQPKFFSEGSQQRKEDFIHECESWIELGLHPNIVSCYYVRSIGGVPSIFSEWMDGGSLKDQLRDRTLYHGEPGEILEKLLDIAIQTARGLRFSHSKDLLHLDVKPGNILMNKEGDVKLSDFGLSKAGSKLTEGTAQAISGYTAEYCPDAQKTSKTPSAWMDGFAWAVTILELFTGGRKWKTGQEAYRRFNEIVRDTIIPVPKDLSALLKKCLSNCDRGLRKGKDDHLFNEIESTLLRIYSVCTGSVYRNPDPDRISDKAGTLNNTALSYYDLGRKDIARDLIEKAFELDPDPAVVYNRNLIMLREGQPLKTVDMVRTLAKSIRDRGNEADALLYMKMCMEPMLCVPCLEYREMTELAQKAQLLSDDDTRILDHAGEICGDLIKEEDLIFTALGKKLLEEKHFVDIYGEYERALNSNTCRHYVHYNTESGRFWLRSTDYFNLRSDYVLTGFFDRSSGQVRDIRITEMPENLYCQDVSPDAGHMILVSHNHNAKYPFFYPVPKEGGKPGRYFLITKIPVGWKLGDEIAYEESGRCIYCSLYPLDKSGERNVSNKGIVPKCQIAKFELSGKYVSTVHTISRRSELKAIRCIRSKLYLLFSSSVTICDPSDGSASDIDLGGDRLVNISEDGKRILVFRNHKLTLLETESLRELGSRFISEFITNYSGRVYDLDYDSIGMRRGYMWYWKSAMKRDLPKYADPCFIMDPETTPGSGFEVKRIHSYVEISENEQRFRMMMKAAEDLMTVDVKAALDQIRQARSIEGYENDAEALGLEHKCLSSMNTGRIAIRRLIPRAEKKISGAEWQNAAVDRAAGRIAYYDRSDLVIIRVPDVTEELRILGVRPSRLSDNGLSFSPDGSLLFAGNGDRQGTLYDKKGKAVWTRNFSGTFRTSAYSSNGRYIAVILEQDRGDSVSPCVELLSSEDGSVIAKISEYAQRHCCLFINDDREIVFSDFVGSSSGALEYRRIPELPPAEKPSLFARLFGSKKKTNIVREIPEMELIGKTSAESYASIRKPMTFNNGEDIFGQSCGRGSEVVVYNKTLMKHHKVKEGHAPNSVLQAFDIDPKGELLAVSDQGGEIAVKAISGDTVIQDLTALKTYGGVSGLFFTNGRRYLTILAGDSAVRVYELDMDIANQ